MFKKATGHLWNYSSLWPCAYHTWSLCLSAVSDPQRLGTSVQSPLDSFHVTLRYQMYCTYYYYCLTILFLLVIAKLFLWRCCFRSLFFKSCCKCESSFSELRAEFSPAPFLKPQRLEAWRGRGGCIWGLRNALWYDCQKKIFKNWQNLQTVLWSSALKLFYSSFLLSVCPVELVRHWCHYCALCHLQFEGWSRAWVTVTEFYCVCWNKIKMLQ